MYCENNNSNNYLSLNQLRLFNVLQRLWIEHVMWTRFFLVSTASNLSDLQFVTERLLRNPIDFTNVLSQFYGTQKALEFEKLFTEHLLIAAQIVNAAKVGDAKTVAEQRDKWYINADEIINFLTDINPYWNKSEWKTMFYNHLQMTENEAVQILTGQYADSILLYDFIQTQAIKMANIMSHGIINQFKL